MVPNFPPSAQVSWRSKDEAHDAEIDFGEIFADEIIRHNVSRGEMADVPDGEYENDPALILEVNDRIIRVWMRARVPTKSASKAGRQFSDLRNDLVLVKTYTY